MHTEISFTSNWSELYIQRLASPAIGVNDDNIHTEISFTGEHVVILAVKMTGMMCVLHTEICFTRAYCNWNEQLLKYFTEINFTRVCCNCSEHDWNDVRIYSDLLYQSML